MRSPIIETPSRTSPGGGTGGDPGEQRVVATFLRAVALGVALSLPAAAESAPEAVVDPGPEVVRPEPRPSWAPLHSPRPRPRPEAGACPAPAEDERREPLRTDTRVRVARAAIPGDAA